MITPKVHITLPEHFDEDAHDEERHFAPILPLLEGLIKVNEWHLRRGLRRAQKGLGPPIPPLYVSGVRYKEDPPGQENWKDCLAVLADGHGDCLPLSTLVLRDDYTAVPLYALRPGDRILGQDVWTEVRECMATGEKEILSFKLSNGCVLRCSRDHRLFRDVDGRVEEIRAEEARVGDDLIQLSRLPKASEEDIAWPDALSRAPEKHLVSLRFATDESVRSVLEGLAADASIERREGKSPNPVYGTTSSRLALQLRVLYRMLGISVSIRRVDEHGGFGEHPIYRVAPRLLTREGYAERREKKFARIRAIADGGIELCGDIQTDSGRFWLPESDVIVHNCDRLVAWRVAELRVAGYPADPIIKWRTVPKDVMVGLGHPPHMVPEEGIQMVHVCVGLPGWEQYAVLYEDNPLVEDPSKRLGMGGSYTSRV